jgi:hypothetical protein
VSGDRAEARRLNEEGRRLDEEGDPDGATRAYARAIDADPGWSVPWYNLGLVHKYRGAWQEALRCTRRATELDPQDGDAWWNHGIAATALGRWEEAREAWRGCGVDLAAGDGPPSMALGMVPIRLAPAGASEVVWCDRIDPARAVIRNVPLAASGRRWRDVVLHDGAVNGYRSVDGREYGVFDELGLLEPSGYRTYEVRLQGVREEDQARLGGLAEVLEAAAENWSRSIRYLCRQCSEGRPHGEHDRELSGARPDLGFGVAARDDGHLARVLAEWAGLIGGERIEGWHALPETGRP